ncbi:MAG: hypothetical protein OHK0031_18890 [Anaerolineales bacterium]
MKAIRTINFALVLLLMFSFLTPSSAYAKSAAESVQPAAKIASLTVDNRTGGTLYIQMTGANYYSFSTSNAGKTTFENIKPGKYTITLTTSACPGSLVFKNRQVKNHFNIKPVGCNKRR